jgi:hypothetical protein
LHIKLLLVEDDAATRQEFGTSVDTFNHKYSVNFEITECATLGEALSTLDGTFDCAVVDMRLGDDGGEGNEVLKALARMNLRIPIVVLAGTPGEADARFAHIEVLTKGEAKHSDLLESFLRVHGSGLTNVMGGRGQIETLLNRVYITNIIPQIDVWKAYGVDNPKQTERALMRHTLNHLIQLVDVDEENFMPEEFYIHPPVDANLRTGCIVTNKESGLSFVVMNPLCDLTVRPNGKFKAENIVLARIEDFDEVFSRLPKDSQTEPRKTALKKELRSNRKGPSYHALPGANPIEEGFLNFENVMSIGKGDFADHFEAPTSQISPAFAKDIIARFASYIGRQGQPVVNYFD